MMRKRFGSVLALLTAAGIAGLRSAWAQEGAAAAARPGRDLLSSVISTLIFAVIGIILAVIGFKVFDMVIKADIEKEIFENKNLAAAVLAGSVVLGVCLIIAATILSP